MGDSDQVKQTLYLVDDIGNKFSYPLTSYKSSNLNLKGLDQSNAWFKNLDVDLKDVPDGKYKIYILTETSEYSDLVSLYDFRDTGTLSFEFESRIYEFKVNTNLRNKYYLEITTN